MREYQGEFKNGDCSGLARMWDNDRKLIYEGVVVDGKLNVSFKSDFAQTLNTQCLIESGLVALYRET